MLRPKLTKIFSIIFFWMLISVFIQPISAQEGKLAWSKIISPALADNLIGDPATKSYAIYLPPSYETSDKLYPVLYVLHGYTGNAGSLTNIKPTIDRMIRNHDIGEIIVVFVDGSNKFYGSEYLSSKTIGDYETYITKDLVDHIDTNYRTITNRSSRGITGYSMGGYGAMRLALKYPDVFSVTVPQAGFYDVDTDWFKNTWAKPIAFANPKNWAEFSQMFWMTQGGFACAAGMSPNTDKPPFFFDKPYELVDGKAQLMPEVWKRWIEADVIHGHLDRYIKQPIQLKGIMIVHGKGDGIVSVNQAQALDKALKDLGIEHIYDEHAGGHDFIAEKSLQFMSEHLAFEQVPTGLAWHQDKLAASWGKMKSQY